MFSEDIIQQVWNKARVVKGYDAETIRKDSSGAWILRTEYGNTNSIYGWEIDHIYPKVKGGDDNIDNLRAVQWENNRSKGDDYPSYNAVVQSDGNENVYAEKQYSINSTVQEKLQRLYNI